MKKTLRVALIGCGAISDNHISAILSSENAELVAICDVIRERAEKKKQAYGIDVNLYTDYRAMLDSEELDVIHVATPHDLHTEMTLAALQRDINVFLEKPMCIREEDIDKLIEAEKKSKGRVCVCFQNRFNKITEAARRVAEDDGGVVAAYVTQFWHRDAEYYAQDAWRGTTAHEGGGVMINQAIHQMDLLCFFLGKPTKICACAANHSLKGVVEVEDSCEGFIEFEGGKRANFYATNSASVGDYTSVVLITKNHRIEMRHPYLFVDSLVNSDAKNIIPETGKACYGEGHDYVIDSFYKALLQGTRVPVSLDEAQHAVRIVLAAYRSKNELINI